MRKIKWPKIGQYVLVTKWSDKDPHDPWHISFVEAIIIRKDAVRYKIQGSNREWNHCFRITAQEGDLWLEINKFR
jgi:hypothetical protein